MPGRDIAAGCPQWRAWRVSADPVAKPAAQTRGFSTFKGGCGRETDCLLEGDGFEPSVPVAREPVYMSQARIWPRWCRLGSWVVSRTRTSDDLAPWRTRRARLGRRPGDDPKWPQVAASLAKTAKGKQGLNFIAGQSKIENVKAVSHVSYICCTGEGQHPKLESETIDYLRNRLVIIVGNLGHAWFQKSLPISRK